MKIVLPGGTGQVGQLLARELAQRGHQVVVLSRGRGPNPREMLESRADSTRVVGQAIEAAANPPRVWLQMSTATIYAHRFDAPNDEATGIIGGGERDAPDTWRFSIDVARAW